MAAACAETDRPGCFICKAESQAAQVCRALLKKTSFCCSETVAASHHLSCGAQGKEGKPQKAVKLGRVYALIPVWMGRNAVSYPVGCVIRGQPRWFHSSPVCPVSCCNVNYGSVRWDQSMEPPGAAAFLCRRGRAEWRHFTLFGLVAIVNELVFGGQTNSASVLLGDFPECS